jgi:cytoskeleton protein RodZ
MPSVGAYLRQLRETRGVSLEEIARVTRVSSSYLHALEADDFSALPEPVFTRGFVRSYCQTLGETPDEALALYEGRPEGPGSAAAPAPRAATARATSAAAHATTELASRNRGPVLVSFILLVVLGVALFAVTLALQSGRETSEERRGARGTTPTAPPASAGRATDGPSSGATSTPASGAGGAAGLAGGTQFNGYRLVARAVETTWIRVRTEEGRTTEETIPAGQSREWFSTKPFTLTVGNAGGLKLEVNGRAIPPLGPSGVVIPRLVLPTESP